MFIQLVTAIIEKEVGCKMEKQHKTVNKERYSCHKNEQSFPKHCMVIHL